MWYQNVRSERFLNLEPAGWGWGGVVVVRMQTLWTGVELAEKGITSTACPAGRFTLLIIGHCTASPIGEQEEVPPN